MVLQLKLWQISQFNNLLCSRSFSKCKSLKTHQDSFFCSEWEENREFIISFFKPKSPTIAGWLKLVGHEVEHLLGWDDQVLDGTRVTFPHLIMSYFHSRFVQLLKQCDSEKVTKQRLDRLRLEFSSGIKASASALKKKCNNFTKSKGNSASKYSAQMNPDYDSETDSDE
jgi:hypothetical protein